MTTKPTQNIKFTTYRRSREDFEDYLRRKNLTGKWAGPDFYRVNLEDRTIVRLEGDVFANS